MTTATILMLSTTYAQGALALAGLLAMVRIVIGPRAQDRVLAVDAFYITAMLLFIVTGMKLGTPFFFEAALVIGVCGFVGTVALAKFLLRGDAIE